MKIVLVCFLAFASVNTWAGEIFKSLPQGNRLAKVAAAVGTQLNDGNISTGSTKLSASQLSDLKRVANTSAVKILTIDAFAAAHKSDTGEVLPRDIKTQVNVGHFVDGEGPGGTIHNMTAALMRSNDYNTKNKQLWQSQARYLWAVARQLPVNARTWVGSVKTQVMDSSVGELRTIQYFILVNPDGRALQFFTIQGTM